MKDNHSQGMQEGRVDVKTQDVPLFTYSPDNIVKKYWWVMILLVPITAYLDVILIDALQCVTSSNKFYLYLARNMVEALFLIVGIAGGYYLKQLELKKHHKTLHK